MVRRFGVGLPLAGSILTHLSLFLALWFWLDRRPTVLPPSRIAGPISVSLTRGHVGQGAAGGAPASPKIARAKSPSQATPRRRLRDLKLQPRGFGWGAVSGGEKPGAAGGASGGGDGGPPDGFDVANGMGLEEEGRLYPFFGALWKEIDQATDYPKDFVHERITGTVTVQLEIDRQGRFTGKLRGFHSDQPYLEAYVLAVLFHALKDPLPPRLWTDRDDLVLVTQFDFSTFTWGQVPPAREKIALKNIFRFERHGYTEPKVNEEIEKVMTRYIPPIIPIGGFYIDFYRTYLFIQNLRNRFKVDEDGLRHERIELSREQWEGLVRPKGAD